MSMHAQLRPPPASRWRPVLLPDPALGDALEPLCPPPASLVPYLLCSLARVRMQPPTAAAIRVANASPLTARRIRKNRHDASSSTSQATRDALHRRHHRRLHLRPPEIAVVVPAAPVHPRARARRHQDRCELSSVSPPSPCSISCRSPATRRNRERLATGHVAVVARATVASARAHHHAQCNARRP